MDLQCFHIVDLNQESPCSVLSCKLWRGSRVHEMHNVGDAGLLPTMGTREGEFAPSHLLSSIGF